MNRHSTILLLCVLALLGFRAEAGKCPGLTWPAGVNPQRWSAASTWSLLGMHVPVAGSNVTIPSGAAILFDLDDDSPIFNTIVLTNASSLYFDVTQPLVHLKAMSVQVLAGALFQIGSPVCLYTSQAVITLVGPYNAAAITDATVKSISVHGTLELHGPAPAVSWTHLATTALAGSTSITLATLTGWKVGDEIVMASTDFDPMQSESFFITEKSSGGLTFTLDHPIQFTKWAGNPSGPSWDNVERCEVGILTRNILIQGDNQSSLAGFGGHVIGFSGGIQRIEGVEYRKMGMYGIVARYAVHWHFVGETLGTNQYVKNCAIHDNFLRCVTVHHTNSILVQNNVAFNTSGHCFYLEDGWEQNNVFDGNLAIMATPGIVVPTDGRPSMFWITNPNNTFTNNVAVGGAGAQGVGFWFSLPASPINFSYSTSPTIFPVDLPIKRFFNNTAHSTGWCLAIAEPVNQYGVPFDTLYTPSGPSVLDSVVLYKCSLFGAWIRAQNTAIVNSWIADSGAGLSLAGSRNLAENLTLVGQTSNNLHVASGSMMGIEGYDNGGSNYHQNITCYQFFSGARAAGCISARDAGQVGAIIPTNVYAQIFTPDGSVPFRTGTLSGDGESQWVGHDQDGSWLGTIGGYALDSSPLLRFNVPDCTFVNSNYWYCPPFYFGYSFFTLFNNDMANTLFGNPLLYNSDYVTIFPFGDTAMQNGLPMNGLSTQAAGSTFQVAVPLNRGYLLRFPYPTPSTLSFSFYAGIVGDWILFAIPYPPGLSFTLEIFGKWYGMAPSLANISSAQPLFYDNVKQLLYVKFYYVTITAPYDWPGLYDYNEPGEWIYLSANCSGLTCATPTSLSTYVPPVYDDGLEKFEVVLCGPAGYAGKGYFTYNPATGDIYHNIFHKLHDAYSITIGPISSHTPFSPARGTGNIVGGFAGTLVTVHGLSSQVSGSTVLVSAFGYNSNTVSLCPASTTASSTTAHASTTASTTGVHH